MAHPLQNNLAGPPQQLVEVCIVCEDGSSKTQEYPRTALLKFSPVLRDLLLKRTAATSSPYVKAFSMNSKTQKERIVLEGNIAGVYFFLLDNIAKSEQLPRPKTAPFPTDQDIHYYATLFRAANYLEVKYAITSLTDSMYFAARNLPRRDTVQAVYRDFKANTLPREVVTEAIVEHCLAMIFEAGWQGDLVWNEVVLGKYHGVRDLQNDVNSWWRRMYMIRQGKRAFFVGMQQSQQMPLQIPAQAPGEGAGALHNNKKNPKKAGKKAGGRSPRATGGGKRRAVDGEEKYPKQSVAVGKGTS
ncbi:MAG: hypothetical protein Q9160_005977 [Pyrenula sp. 1 TL-2023]